MRVRFLALFVFAACLSSAADIQLKDGLGINVPGNRRTPVRIDPVERLLIQDQLAPKDGDAIGNSKWSKLAADKDGWFSGPVFRGGYAYFEVNSDKEEFRLLEAQGNGMVYVNGAPRVGDIYGFGYLSLPVKLNKGVNKFLFSVGRGRFRATLVEPAKPISFDLRDATWPDFVQGDKEPKYAAVVVKNATGRWLDKLSIEATCGLDRVSQTVQSVGPETIRKIHFRIRSSGETKVVLNLRENGKVIDTAEVNLRMRTPRQSRKVTFVSSIDGSVQYYGLQPSTNPGPNQALFLSLHGASVEAIGQADAYAPKAWGHIVAPTNRRPYGFDWEEIGRLDALEVLEHARKMLDTDPNRTYLTGHSMGGHGTWQIGAHYPSKFAAIAPSAGWISFFTYAGGQQFQNPDPVEALLNRATNPSNTLLLKHNYAQQGIYTVHGDADDNVPVTEAREMRKQLEGFHRDFSWHEQPGAGHWWENSDEPGAECVDWPGIFDMFARRRIPNTSEVRDLDFTTVDPGISSDCHWLRIISQTKRLQPSRAILRWDPMLKRISGRTENIDWLAFDMSELGPLNTLVLDGEKIDVESLPKSRGWDALMDFHKVNGKWTFITERRIEKMRLNSAGFKSVFNHNVTFIAGTKGTPEENAWSYARARYDAESLYYRGNGSPDVVLDSQQIDSFLRNRNVLMYGSESTNGAIASVIKQNRSDALKADNSGLTVGTKALSAPGLAYAVAMRNPFEHRFVAAIVGGNGLRGMRLSDRAPYFTSGAAFPDVLVWSPDMLTDGSKGVIGAGYWGNDWSFEKGEWAFR